MSLELATLDPSVDELVEKYKAWKLMAGLYKDPSILKAKVLKAGTIKGKEPSRSSTSSGSNSEVPECQFCKEKGHVIANCLKVAAQICRTCGEKSHDPRFCPRLQG